MVIGTTSSEEKAELARAAGADHVIGYDGFAEQVRELTGGEGASVVYDGIGAATFAESLKALRPRGLAVLFGAASGPPPPLDAGRARTGRLALLTRPTLTHYTLTREELLERASDVFGWIARRQARGQDRRHATRSSRRGRRRRTSRDGETTGKLILLPCRTQAPLNRTSTGHRAALCTHAAASSVAAIALLSPLPASLASHAPISHSVGAWSTQLELLP